ncbi:hypothetical protein FISHEDRAFT_60735 [Fistulina hepatica ATCC 64428]|uniref:Cyclin N-terminal domain-containing protein n=1 Tax=Fistulina hepatica ATCC 64428 TaxID=1128425 RepID=A0A0D7A7K1_9AGAR|nr:hypothetical protein FISHEDRAFT_60735 [Fistulina hepatica ATCC 64428]
MPVPVPRFSKHPSHPVVKRPYSHHGTYFPSLISSKFAPPLGFEGRSQRSSLPLRRRNRPLRIWEDDSRCPEDDSGAHVTQGFHFGLTHVDSAHVIKGERADACIPPSIVHPDFMDVDDCPGDEHDDEKSAGSSIMAPSNFDNISESDCSDGGMAAGRGVEERVATANASGTYVHCNTEYGYERGAFSPVYEDDYPGALAANDVNSSPIEPVTPFGDFVDRVVTADQSHVNYEADPAQPYYDIPQCEERYYDHEPAPKEEQPEVSVPVATPEYKKLAEPLSEWVANYVWKVCTTGLSLPHLFCRVGYPSVEHLSVFPPSCVGTSVHSLLLSTLLQPSAVFLAIRYIVHLPVFFGETHLNSAEHPSEILFRDVLLNVDDWESNAIFRIIVLGCMLANKWLDDHTFSNKTWHSITGIPVRSINRLEFLALAIFRHDLSIPNAEWQGWLQHLLNYHNSGYSPSHQPIGRPSSNPHVIIKKALEEIAQAPDPIALNHVTPQPVFIGLEKRRQEASEREQARQVEVMDIDLDEDGPLREEYIPKRRISNAGSSYSHVSGKSVSQSSENSSSRDWRVLAATLPPPAKWSPAADEPILRPTTRGNRLYSTIQPPAGGLPTMPAFSSTYHHIPETSHHEAWPVASYAPAVPHYLLPAYNPYNAFAPAPPSHGRSHSLSYDSDVSHFHNHERSYSQAPRCEYQCSNLRMTANSLEPSSSYAGSGRAIDRQPFAPFASNCAHPGYPTPWPTM